MSQASSIALLVAEAVAAVEAVGVAQQAVREERITRIAAAAMEHEEKRQRELSASREAAGLEAAEEPSASEEAPGAPTAPPAVTEPEHSEAADAFAVAAERATKLTHRLLVHSMHGTDSVEVCRSPAFQEFTECVAEVVGVDHETEVIEQVGLDVNFALNVVSLFGNLCVFEDAREYLPSPDTCARVALTCIRHQPTNRRLVHLCLMAVSNVALCPDLRLPPKAVAELVDAVVPLYDQSPVVEAWACALCNVASTTAENLAALVAGGATARLETLMMYHGDNERVAARGFQCLSCLGAAFSGFRASRSTSHATSRAGSPNSKAPPAPAAGGAAAAVPAAGAATTPTAAAS